MRSGYMPPEYLFRHVVSKKLDVFSLGVIITKIIAGPKGHTRSAEMPYKEFLDQVQITISSLRKNDHWL
jgi:interleukin-1 receptor-associated kinase 1/coatomer subunit beta'